MELFVCLFFLVKKIWKNMYMKLNMCCIVYILFLFDLFISILLNIVLICMIFKWIFYSDVLFLILCILLINIFNFYIN